MTMDMDARNGRAGPGRLIRRGLILGAALGLALSLLPHGGLAAGAQPAPMAAPPGQVALPTPAPKPMAAPPAAAPAPVASAPAAAATSQPRMEPLTADVMGALMGGLTHQFGRFLIAEEKLAVTGSADQMADQFTALLMIANLKSNPNAAEGAIDAAVAFWLDLAKNPAEAKAVPAYQQHGPDLARLKAMVCLLYGAAPTQMEGAARQVGLAAADQKPCAETAAQARANWDKLLADHRRRGADPVQPGNLAANAPGHRITVEYDSPQDPQARKYQAYFLESGVFEQLSDIASKVYVLPRDTKLILRECGPAGGSYNPADGSMTICYETVTVIAQTFLKIGVPSAGPFAAPLPVAAAAPAPVVPRPVPLATAPTPPALQAPQPMAVRPAPAPAAPPSTAAAPPAPAPPPVAAMPRPAPVPPAAPQTPAMPQPVPPSAGGYGPAAPPAPSPPPANQGRTLTLAQYMVGVWQFSGQTADGPATIVIQLNGDGSYAEREAVQTQMGAITVLIYGRWAAEGVSDSQFRLELQPVQWQPTQFCTGWGACYPIQPSASSDYFTPIDMNNIRSQNGTAVRLQ